MATKSDPVVERRLRPIYDFIDAGNHKKALQEVDRVLKKQKDCTCARVLKSLALIRLNRLGEAKEILGAVHEESPTDDPTLQAMLRLVVDLIADAYRRAVAKEPNNEELLSHLFMSHVRLGDYKKQQDVGMALYKLVPKNPYFFWSVMSLYLQAITEVDKKKSSLLLTLAEKRVQKFVDDGKIEAEAEVDLYLMILEKKEKYEEILRVAEGPLGKHVTNHLEFFARKKALIYLRLSDHSKAFDSFKNLLSTHPDQIEFYENLFDVALLTNTHEHDLSGSKEYVLELVNLLKESTSDQSPYYNLRGPHLAKIELFYLLKSCETDHPTIQDLRSLLAESAAKLFLEYFQLFGHKTACFYDFLYILTTFKQSRNDLADIITELKSKSNEPWPDDMNEMNRQLVILFLSFMKQEQCLSVDEKLERASDLCKRYHHCLPLSEHLLSSDAHPEDGHMILAAHVLMDDPVVNEQLLTIAVVALAKCLESSPSNNSAKLLLMSLYSYIGAGKANQIVFNTLDVKYVQLDTLGYMATTLASSCGHYLTSLGLYNNSLKFYNTNNKDTTDFMISCYKYGTFTRIEEVMNLRFKLDNSVQYISTTLERMILDLIQNAKSVESVVELVRSFEMNPLKDRTDWDILGDNRDFKSFGFNSLHAERCIEEKKAWTFECEKRWLQVRSLIIRSIAASFYSFEAKILNVDPFITNGTPDPVSPLQFLIDQLKEHQAGLSVPTINSKIVWGCATPRLVEYVREPYLEIHISILEMVYSIEIDAKTHSGDHNAVLFDRIVDNVIEKAKDCRVLRNNVVLLDTISHVVDCFGFACVILALTTNYFRVTNQGKKNKKKMKDLSLSGSLPDLVEDVKRNLGSSVDRLNTFLKDLKLTNTMDDSLVEKVIHVWDRKDMERIIGKVEESLDNSYKKSLEEFSQMLTLYSKLVQSMISK